MGGRVSHKVDSSHGNFSQSLVRVCDCNMVGNTGRSFAARSKAYPGAIGEVGTRLESTLVSGLHGKDSRSSSVKSSWDCHTLAGSLGSTPAKIPS